MEGLQHPKRHFGNQTRHDEGFRVGRKLCKNFYERSRLSAEELR